VLAPELYDRLVGFVSWAVPLTTTYLYWIYPVGRWGWRRGKQAVSLFVVNTHGTPPGQAKAVGRALLAVLLGWILFLPWWQVPFRADGRGMHDMATDVWVIQDPLA
ncbi:MAG: RDD family protein, partial [Thermomicrobium sp.]|nr:RDD family protein [Thermomicrobium sp.]